MDRVVRFGRSLSGELLPARERQLPLPRERARVRGKWNADWPKRDHNPPHPNLLPREKENRADAFDGPHTVNPAKR